MEKDKNKKLRRVVRKKVEDETVLFNPKDNDDTQLLLHNLKSKAYYEDFAKECKDQMLDESFKLVLSDIIFKRGYEVQEFADEVGISKAYAYQLLNGSRRPTRDKLVMIAIRLELSLKETNRLLVAAEKKELYVKNKRDSVIIYAISHGFILEELNELLREEDLLEI